MPGEDGLHFADSLRRLLKHDHCAIIMISSDATALDEDVCQTHGIGCLMNKPVIASELLNEVLRQFGGAPTIQPVQVPLSAKAAHVCPRRVLLVEDNEINRRVAVGLIRARGHHVDVAENGQEAIDTLAEQEFDVVLMDMQMPVMDGYEATAAIRNREHQTGGHMPIVAMTAEALKGDRERCLAIGMDDYVAKPIVPAEMYRAIERFPAVCLETGAGLRHVRSVSSPSTATFVANGGETRTALAEPARSKPEPNAPAPSTPPAIDWSVAKVRLAGGPAMLHEYIDLVKSQIPTLLDDIRHAIETRDAKLLRRAAHTLKGSVVYFGAAPLVEAAVAFENQGRAESFDGAGEQLATLEREIARFLADLEVGPGGSTS